MVNKIVKWHRDHTSWNSWEDLSRRELFRLYSWNMKQDETLRFRAGAVGTPDAVIMTWLSPGSSSAPGNLQDLQMVRRLLQQMGTQQIHWYCAVEMAHFNRRDPLTEGNDEYNFHAKLAIEMVRAEAESDGNVHCNLAFAQSSLECQMHFDQCVRSMSWSQSPLRIVIPATETMNVAHSAAMRRGLPFRSYANYALRRWPGDPQEHEQRHLPSFRGGGGLYLSPHSSMLGRNECLHMLGIHKSRKPRNVKLWMFYMDDEVPSMSQVRDPKHFNIPFSLVSATKQVQPGEAMAHFIHEFVQKKKGAKNNVLNVILVPYLTSGSVHKISRNISVMSFKGIEHVQGFLRHCEDWVACEGMYALSEFCRAGKRIFFRHRNQHELNAWKQYASSLSDTLNNGEMDYRHMVTRASKAKLQDFGERYSNILQTVPSR